jgi:selenocysteine lyase/cysteine desulfurase
MKPSRVQRLLPATAAADARRSISGDVTTNLEAHPLLTDQRAAFIVDDEIAYFNTASLAPMLRSVRAAGEAALELRSRPWTINATDWFDRVEELRSRAARLMRVATTDVALIPASSYGLATAALQLRASRGDRVLVMEQEFPSNYYTWQRFAQRHGAELEVVRREPGQTWTDAVVDAVDERVAVAALPNVHWNNGALVELERIAPLLHEASAAFVIDASQSLGVMPLDIARLQPDFVVAVGYKWLLGPYSLGYLYVDPRHHNGAPLEDNWIAREGSEDFSALGDYGASYRPGAQRFDVGERSNFQLTPMASAAIGQILEWTVERIGATLRETTRSIADGAAALGLAVEPEEQRAPHIVGVGLPRETAQRVAAALAESKVVISVRGQSLRIAPHLHVNRQDVDRLLSALGAAVEGAT